MNTKHTPAPWKVEANRYDLSITNATGFYICPNIGTSGSNYDNGEEAIEGERLANAKLIASAPELLDLLRRMRDELWQREETALHTPALVVEADALIAQATGR